LRDMAGPRQQNSSAMSDVPTVRVDHLTTRNVRGGHRGHPRFIDEVYNTRRLPPHSAT